MNRHPAGFLILSTIFLAGLGCTHQPHGDKVTGRVTVTVTNQGKPVSHAVISFLDLKTGLGGAGLLDEHGKVVIPKIPIGDHSVSITDPPPDTPDPNPQSQKRDDIPRRFLSETTSPLKATIVKGDNNFDFDLGIKPQPK